MAKVTSKGQITIPVSIRKRLGIYEGDKVLFIDSPNGVVMVNPDSLPAGQGADALPANGKILISPEAAPRNNAGQRAVAAPRVRTAPRAGPAPAGKGTSEPAGEEARVKGLDVGALLDEIRSIGSKI